MHLVKSCHAKDHIRSRNTLKLGTLHEYRATEIKEIADADEGTYVFTLNFIGAVSVDIAWYKTLATNTVCIGDDYDDIQALRFPGRTDAHFLDVTFGPRKGRTIELIDSTAIIKREVLNSFIFCMSQVREIGEASEIFPHYDDNWSMSIQRARLFADRSGKLLLREIRRRRQEGQHIVPEHLDLDRLDVSIQHGPVTYAPRALTFGNGADLTLERLAPLLASMAFLKTKNYSHEREYRFQYTLVYAGMIVEPLSKDIIIRDASWISELI